MTVRMYNIIILLAVAVSYFFYHWHLISYIEDFYEGKRSWGRMLGTYVLNYLLFIALSLQHVHLVVNWLLFFLIFWLETGILYRKPAAGNAYLAISGVMLGLASNILTRCLFAIAWNVPLNAFDNQSGEKGNLKQYPVLAGFFVAGILFWIFRKADIATRARILIREWTGLKYLLVILAALSPFLLLNLLTYYTKGTSFMMNLWGVKSVVFSLMGYYLAVVYCIRISELSSYQEKNRRERESLLLEKQDDERMKTIAYTDSLTGCYNRQYAEEVLEEICKSDADFCICFVDLNHLKRVNDQFGHVEGDRYLITAAGAMKKIFRDTDYCFRYGGDEFLILSFGMTPQMIDKRFRLINQSLENICEKNNIEKLMSVSYGTAMKKEASDWKSLIKIADERMYTNKQKSYSISSSKSSSE